MEPRSRENTPTKEDLDFIVDDGYQHDKDPDYIPPQRYILEGTDFKRLTKNAKKLGAESLDYSTRKNNKYMATLQVERKFTLGHLNIQTTLFTKIKREEINTYLVL